MRELVQTDLPEPVVPAISRWGSLAMLPTIQLPPMSFPRAKATLESWPWRLTETIHSFGIDANIVSVTRGPSVTRYELELDQGVRHHFHHRPLKGSRRLLGVGDHRDEQMGDPVVDPQLHHLGSW